MGYFWIFVLKVKKNTELCKGNVAYYRENVINVGLGCSVNLQMPIDDVLYISWNILQP